MSTYLDKLNEFYEAEDKYCLLLRGPWGVGKTYLVDSFLKHKKRTAKVSLFGIKEAGELYSVCFCAISKLYRFKKNLRKIDQNISFGIEPVSATVPAIGLLQALLDDAPKAPNRQKRKTLIVIDDIERSDNQLTVNQIFGCAELIKNAKIKVILIANNKKLSKRSADFDSFKEKVIDAEICIPEPTLEAKQDVLGPSLTPLFANEEVLSLSNNLRTLTSLKEVVEKSGQQPTKEMVILAYLILMNIRERQFTKTAYIKEEEREYGRVMRYYESGSEKNDNKAFLASKRKELEESIKDEKDALVLFIRKRKWATWIDEEKLKDVIGQMYEAISKQEYESLPVFEQTKNRPVIEKRIPTYAETIFYSADPVSEYEKAKLALEEALQDSDYQVGEIIKEYLGCFVTAGHYAKVIANPFLDKCVSPLAKEINRVGLGIALAPLSFMIVSQQAVANEYASKAKIEALREQGIRFSKELDKGINCVNEMMDYLNQFLYESQDIKKLYFETFGGDQILAKMAVPVCDSLNGAITGATYEDARRFFSWLHDIIAMAINNKSFKEALPLCAETIGRYTGFVTPQGKRVNLLCGFYISEYWAMQE